MAFSFDFRFCKNICENIFRVQHLCTACSVLYIHSSYKFLYCMLWWLCDSVSMEFGAENYFFLSNCPFLMHSDSFWKFNDLSVRCQSNSVWIFFFALFWHIFFFFSIFIFPFVSVVFNFMLKQIQNHLAESSFMVELTVCTHHKHFVCVAGAFHKWMPRDFI